MKTNLITTIFFLMPVLLYAQVKTERVEFEKIPKRISSDSTRFFEVNIPNKEKVISDLQLGIDGKVLERDNFNFGVFVPLEIDFEQLKPHCDVDFCHKEIEVQSKGANTLGFVFSDLVLSKNAKLMIINEEEGYIQGPIGREEVNIKHGFISGLMPGDKLRIRLSEPKDELGISKVKIAEASHGIFDFFRVEKYSGSRLSAGPCFGCSAPCNSNIACVTNLDIESKAVALILVKSNGNYKVRGTGALLNNGNQNLRPIFITAAHLYNQNEWADSSQFMFHFRSLQCSPTTYGQTTYYVQGSNNVFGAGSGSTDLKLIELKVNPGISPLFSNHPVSYLGWSIIDEITPVQGIHHPLGDVQKHFSGVNVQLFNETIDGFSYHYWRFDLADGVFQIVSSGSPVLNHHKRLIGSLSAKRRDTPDFVCGGNNVGALAGRMSRSWSQFCQYLDPNNEGIVAINTITPSSGAGIKVFPIAAGPNSICTSGTFTLQNAPLDAPITWELIQGASMFSGSTTGSGKSTSLTVLNQTVSGQARIRYTVQNICGPKQYMKTFWVGRPQNLGGILGSTSTYQGNYETFSVASVGGASQYNWQFPTGWTVVGSATGSSVTVIIGSNSGTVSVNASNSCGTSQIGASSYVTVNICQFCRAVDVFPNPAKNSVSVVVESKAIGSNEPKELKAYYIYDMNGRLMAKEEDKKLIDPNEITVVDIPVGTYFIHLVFEKETVTRRIVIER